MTYDTSNSGWVAISSHLLHAIFVKVLHLNYSNLTGVKQ